MPFFAGIDGGGTKTRCLIGDEKSQLGAGSSSSCKVQRVGEACARDALAAAVHEACVQAGISPRQIVRTCAGITGAARPEIARVMLDLMASVASGEIEILGDVEIAFEDAFGIGPGVIVIAGTGSIAYGRNADGETARAAGWGYPISDEGSGLWIGAEAVRVSLREYDRGHRPDLLNKLMDELGASNFEDYIVRLNANPPLDFATLFPAVLTASNNGDQIASDVLTRAGSELAAMAGVVMDRLFSECSVSIATHGGVFANSEIIRKYFAEGIGLRFPRAISLDREIDPARGALQRARREFKAVGD